MFEGQPKPTQLVLKIHLRLLTGAILAHELMHGWLRLNGFGNLNPEVEEGICQVLSHMWLEAETMPRLKNMASMSSSTTSSSKIFFQMPKFRNKKLRRLSIICTSKF